MEQDNVRVTIRVDRALKDAADELFNHLGMNMSTALNVFLRKSVDEKCIPFSIGAKPASVGGELTFAGGELAVGDGELAVAEVTRAFKRAVHNAETKAVHNNHPIARYDADSKRAYLEYADGVREYVG